MKEIKEIKISLISFISFISLCKTRARCTRERVIARRVVNF